MLYERRLLTRTQGNDPSSAEVTRRLSVAPGGPYTPYYKTLFYSLALQTDSRGSRGVCARWAVQLDRPSVGARLCSLVRRRLAPTPIERVRVRAAASTTHPVGLKLIGGRARMWRAMPS